MSGKPAISATAGSLNTHYTVKKRRRPQTKKFFFLNFILILYNTKIKFKTCVCIIILFRKNLPYIF